MTTSCELSFEKNTRICGKWNRNPYRIVRLLGEGANGKVYLVSHGGESFAMKIGYESLDLQSEINALKALHQSMSKEPYFKDADDLEWRGKTYTFYVMRYVRGDRLPDYLRKHGREWMMVIGHYLLKTLVRLHRSGWIFGDIKPENIMVAGYGQVELVDFGGLAAMGNSVRQFTQIYDRAYWNAGTRIADPGYDLFSFAVLFLQHCDEQRRIEQAHLLLPQQRNEEYLMDILRSTPSCNAVAEIIASSLQGKYAHSHDALRDWSQAILKLKRRKASRPRWIKGFFIASALLFITAVIYTWR